MRLVCYVPNVAILLAVVALVEALAARAHCSLAAAVWIAQAVPSRKHLLVLLGSQREWISAHLLVEIPFRALCHPVQYSRPNTSPIVPGTGGISCRLCSRVVQASVPCPARV
jgi:hypothetical protein